MTQTVAYTLFQTLPHLVLHADDSLGHNLVEERISTLIGFCVNGVFNSEVFLQN